MAEQSAELEEEAPGATTTFWDLCASGLPRLGLESWNNMGSLKKWLVRVFSPIQ